MGLVVRNLADLPDTSDREYYIYLLDFGWHEPLDEALRDNFDKIATSVSSHKGVVIRRSDDGIHYNDEVLSWHSINGQDVEQEELLPAILITNRHPMEFKKRAENYNSNNKAIDPNFKMIIIPLKKICKTTTDVVDVLIKIINDVKNKKDLNDFRVAKELKPGVGKAITKSLILEPNFYGLGFSFDRLRKELK
ncbi:hypothetical protein [Salegentibacter sp. UBA1130]|uniref:hypothetical protein n=1 Tax=Salegentibacter sp. UBA1130 TaxID=1947451 RepID=UPI00257A5F64|nr:hypothetical protein [Salegentibacter sp. UBA1130]